MDMGTGVHPPTDLLQNDTPKPRLTSPTPGTRYCKTPTPGSPDPNYDGSLTEPVQLNSKTSEPAAQWWRGYRCRLCHQGSDSQPAWYCRGDPVCAREGKVAEASKLLVPDFPTGCDLVKDDGLVQYLNTGNGSLRMRARVEVEKSRLWQTC